MKSFDAIIIGAGQAGPALAGRLTGAGMTVAMIERKQFGGTCVNTGCTPTKTLVASAHTAYLARRAADYGVDISGEIKVDMKRVCARAATVAGNSRTGVEKYLREMSGCTVFDGHARFTAANQVRVGDEELTAPRIFINVGGRALVPPLPGVDQVPFLTNTGMVALDELPEHLIIIGGSYIGLEFAQMYRRFGSQVTVIERGPRLIAREDEEVSEAIREILTGEGVEVRTGAECIELLPHERGAAVKTNCPQGEQSIAGTHLLLAVGRQPNTDDLGLAAADIATDERGYIQVDDTLQTSVPGVWALGDCNGRGAFTHTAYNDFEIVAANLLDGETRRVSDRVTAYALYIDPPLGRVGLTESQARATGRPLMIGKRPMSRVSRAIEKGDTRGFIKIIAEAETHQVLGASILGITGDEAIHGLLDMINAQVPYDQYKWAVPIHPTVSELIPTVLESMERVE